MPVVARCAGNFDDDTAFPWKSDYDDGTLGARLVIKSLLAK